MKNSSGIINSRKYDGSLHRSWECDLISFDGEEIECRGVFKQTVDHSDLGLIPAGTISHEKFWLSRWYNVFRFEEPDGSLRNHYFNISMPPTIDGNIIEFVDLDIDVVLWPDGRVLTLDLDEFEQNRRIFCYPSEVVEMASKTLNEILVEPARHLT